jgi:flagellar hook-length control protein FliK
MDAPSPSPSPRPFGALALATTGRERGRDWPVTGGDDGFASLVSAFDTNDGTADPSLDDTTRDVLQPAAPFTDKTEKAWRAADISTVEAQRPSSEDIDTNDGTPVTEETIVPPRPDATDVGTRPGVRPDAPVSASSGPSRETAESQPPAPPFPRSGTVLMPSQTSEEGATSTTVRPRAGSGPAAPDAGSSAVSPGPPGGGPPVATPRPVGRTETPGGAETNLRGPVADLRDKAETLSQHRGTAKPEAGQQAIDTHHGPEGEIAAKAGLPVQKGSPAQEAPSGVPIAIARAAGTGTGHEAKAPSLVTLPLQNAMAQDGRSPVAMPLQAVFSQDPGESDRTSLSQILPDTMPHAAQATSPGRSTPFFLTHDARAQPATAVPDAPAGKGIDPEGTPGAARVALPSRVAVGILPGGATGISPMTGLAEIAQGPDPATDRPGPRIGQDARTRPQSIGPETVQNRPQPALATAPAMAPARSDISVATSRAPEIGAMAGIDALAPLSAAQPFSALGSTAPAAALAGTGSAMPQQIAQHIAASLPRPVSDMGTGTLELALDPPELGRVRMSLVETAGVMTLSIVADRPETAELMRRHMDILAQEFSRAGLDAPNVRVGTGWDGSGAAPDRGAAPPERGNSEPGTEPAPGAPLAPALRMPPADPTRALDLRL